MTAAFDRVCQSISMRMNASDDVKKTLALIILRHVDRGECNAGRLAEIAFREWTGTERSAIGDRWDTHTHTHTHVRLSIRDPSGPPPRAALPPGQRPNRP
jgi:hypothetical protein